jgi:transcriptional regulator with XRE-family HTH domain
MTDSFGARLRAARERRRITLDTIAHSTKINKALFEGLERDDTARWPSGIFRRAFIRAYAEAVGLDPEAIVAEFVLRFPEAGGDGRCASAAASSKGVVWHDRAAVEPPMRLMLAEEPSPVASAHRRTIDGWSTRAIAALFDVGVLALIAAVFAIAGRFSTGFVIATALYYIGGVLAFGNSPGARLAGRSRETTAPDPHRPARTFTPRLVSRHPRHSTLQRNDPRAAEHTAFPSHNSRGGFTVSRQISN